MCIFFFLSLSPLLFLCCWYFRLLYSCLCYNKLFYYYLITIFLDCFYTYWYKLFYLIELVFAFVIHLLLMASMSCRCTFTYKVIIFFFFFVKMYIILKNHIPISEIITGISKIITKSIGLKCLISPIPRIHLINQHLRFYLRKCEAFDRSCQFMIKCIDERLILKHVLMQSSAEILSI